MRNADYSRDYFASRFFSSLITAVVLMSLLSVPAATAFADEPPLPPGLAPAEEEKQDEPALPPGLVPVPGAGEDEPDLPPGLEPAPTPGKEEEPPLPPGLETPSGPAPSEPPKEALKLPFDLSGFWEARLGARTQHDTRQKHMSLAETRLQLEIERQFQGILFRVTNDFLFDPVQADYANDLETGRGWLDLREAWAAFTPLDFMDVKIGRQILTWGTGDLVFLNDFFPKDWNSFLIGRDVEYLKAPSDAAKTSLFSPLANLDIIYTPAFDADRFIDGSRVTFWNPAVGGLTGRSMRVRAERPQHWFHDDEIALRLYQNLGGVELAAYGYRGFWKSPAGTNPVNGKARFPDLDAVGASARGNLFRGVGNAEFSYLRSREDLNGRNALVRNSEMRFLLGYEQEVATNLTGGVQWYVEHMLDYADYRRNLPAGVKRADETRHVATLRLTKLMMNQNLRISVFSFYSPTDRDAFVLPNIHYKLSDRWSVEAGANLFAGEQPHTFYGQFGPNSNVYAAVRFSF